MNVRDAYWFEDYVANIFREAGYVVEQDKRLENGRSDIDIVAEKDDKKYCIEVKFSRVIDKAIERICIISESCGMIPILVSAYDVTEKKREYYQKEYPELILLDISNLMFAVQYSTKLTNELIARLPYSVEDINPQKGFIEINCFQHDDYTNSLIKEISLCKSGRTTFNTYEKLCYKLLENAFSEDLALWREQQKSNKDLYRFDLLCRIKDDNQKTFWSILERYFNSKYIIFEFKNYSEPITQKEVYTTEKYLYAKALRSVGIIISANGYEENAYWAAKGSLRENGKLIILLDTDDLIAMNKMKLNQEDPSNYLLEKLDSLLLDLEK